MISSCTVKTIVINIINVNYIDIVNRCYIRGILLMIFLYTSVTSCLKKYLLSMIFYMEKKNLYY